MIPDPAAQAARAQHIEKALLELVGATKELVAMLRHEAPGTPLNNHRFDALGVTVNNAITAAIAALEEAGASALHHFKDGDSTRCGAAQERGNSYYEWAYVDCPACLATRAQPSATVDEARAKIVADYDDGDCTTSQLNADLDALIAAVRQEKEQ